MAVIESIVKYAALLMRILLCLVALISVDAVCDAQWPLEFLDFTRYPFRPLSRGHTPVVRGLTTELLPAERGLVRRQLPRRFEFAPLEAIRENRQLNALSLSARLCDHPGQLADWTSGRRWVTPHRGLEVRRRCRSLARTCRRRTSLQHRACHHHRPGKISEARYQGPSGSRSTIPPWRHLRAHPKRAVIPAVANCQSLFHSFRQLDRCL